MENFDFAGWGNSRKITNLVSEKTKISASKNIKENKKLGQWGATAICGNDITSSCLYVSALAIGAAGAYAPIALLVVAAVLYLYRKIYAEVGSALPLNGGTYTVLLNTTNKKFAAFAACLTLLSYVSTAVISAGEAMHYAQELWLSLDITIATILLLAFFAILNIIGISESARLAVIIFFTHLLTLSLLVIACSVTLYNDPSILHLNFSNPLPENSSVLKALFLGFAAAMLGISGFESSANFIEEQQEGVFQKTLRNMWLAVSVFNPLICFLALGFFNSHQINEDPNGLLSHMAEQSIWPWLKVIVSFDAVLVLSGAVLTSYVGVIGLVRRMTLDRCMPDILLSKNKWRKTNHWIILSFFALCCLIFLITNGDVGLLAGVYTISFLCVMALFAVGNILLKNKRSRLPRTTKAPLLGVVIALIFVFVGLIGNLTFSNVRVFSVFFFSIGGIVLLMFMRRSLLRLGIFTTQSMLDVIGNLNNSISMKLTNKLNLINSQKVVYYAKGDNLAELNQAALYVLENEHTNSLTVINFFTEEVSTPKNLAKHLKTIDHMYPQLRIDFIAVEGEFNPHYVDQLSERLNIPRNYMFIGTPGDKFPHKINSLGGVRLIL